MSEVHAETIDLPSRGWFYPPDSPLASGKIEIKYMTAEHEDILTSANLISKGLVIDKFLEALIATKKVKYENLLLGDKSAIILASRILGYGKDYPAKVTCRDCGERQDIIVDLIDIPDKEIEFKEEDRGKNEFELTLPATKTKITFKLLTVKDEREIGEEIRGYAKVSKDFSTEVTSRIRKCLLSVNGETDRGKITAFVKSMPVKDSQFFRNYVRDHTPDVDLTTTLLCESCGAVSEVEVAIDANFFWPDARI